jgi:protein-tyrosine phosphatase
MFNTILVVCVGNICRSPMGEALLAHALKDTHPQVRVQSAGLSALAGHPADPTAQALLTERGIDLSGHRATQITPDMLFESDLVLVMETWQQKELEAQAPAARGKIHRIGKWGEFDVPDPYRRSRVHFEEALALIETGLGDWTAKLWSR